MFELSQLQSVPLVGQIEVDESYFGVRRMRGKRGLGASGKTIVFGLLKRGDKVHTQINAIKISYISLIFSTLSPIKATPRSRNF